MKLECQIGAPAQLHQFLPIQTPSPLNQRRQDRFGGLRYYAFMDRKERRLRPRDRVRLDATIVLGDGLLRVPAVLRNASAFGAKVELLEEWATPERFYVLFDHRLELCRLVWRKDNFLGLAYED